MKMLRTVLVILAVSIPGATGFVNGYAKAQDAQPAPTPMAAPAATSADPAVATPAASVPADEVNIPVSEGKKPELNLIVQAFREGRYMWAVAMILMGLVWMFNMVLKNRVPRTQLRWWSLGAAIAAGIGASLMSAPSDTEWWIALLEAAGSGLTVGWAAMGAWDTAGKSVLPTGSDPTKVG